MEAATQSASTLYDQRASAIRHHLFLLCPNNSGSTFLSQAIGRCSKVWSLEREGQHTFGFAGPSTMRTKWPLIWAASEESLSHFTDSAAYDWQRNKRVWYLQATAEDPAASVFITKAPPFLMLADDLRAAFANTSFIIMVRNPYAALEGILRRRRRSHIADPGDLASIGARHLITCMARQKDNAAQHADISMTVSYEELCADPANAGAQIRALVPGLDDLDLVKRQTVKGIYDEPLRDMNAEQIERLTPADIAAANAVFSQHRDLLAHFGYELI
ncbi:hypothetical protein GCM10009127_25910 [Alteraurantiacibacter aestuarii]|uniref:sulfotransferase n=1 Tax=Alteraurantiacibacter aestuarii TaxID=650004 RepID=UPI0031E3E92D